MTAFGEVVAGNNRTGGLALLAVVAELVGYLAAFVGVFQGIAGIPAIALAPLTVAAPVHLAETHSVIPREGIAIHVASPGMADNALPPLQVEAVLY